MACNFISVGGNRHPAAADWDHESDLLAFGADNNIALWNPLDPLFRGVHRLLSGHTEVVNVVKFFPTGKKNFSILLSGGIDKTIRIWCSDTQSPANFREEKVISDHSSAINTIAVYSERSLFISGSADATVKVWQLNHLSPGHQSSADQSSVECNVELLQTIDIQPRFLPLALAISKVPGSSSAILAVAGTRSLIQIYVSAGDVFKFSASLTGHEGWIRSLSFVQESTDIGTDILLASASQDKFVRLWRLHQGEELPIASSAAGDPALGALGKSLSNKAHRFETQGLRYSLTFEALLLGHEDWIYSAGWCPQAEKPQLLTASADNSLAIWEPDPHSGIWICTSRLGEISAQKGATTATGSTGGFWAGLWSPKGDIVVSIGRTGSWRLWKSIGEQGDWRPGVSISGHIKRVQDLAWSRDGSFLLSTGSDQTTRLFAEWIHDDIRSWHEFSRPQIHGYDLNCIDTTSSTQFISGADEKLLRVFDEPKAVASLLGRACGVENSTNGLSLEAANIPVLGLSNKAVEIVGERPSDPLINGDADGRQAEDPASVVYKSTLDFDHAPLEDHLSRHMLWPETEKLYGHGYEISTVAASQNGDLVATACKSSSEDHAVIRLYETKDWREVKPALRAHSLTVTSLAFSSDDRFILSTGRDRKWTIFERNSDNAFEYGQITCDPKGHSRMILAGSWAPAEFGYIFVTAGRDKSVKIWSLDISEEPKVTCKATISATSPVTAVQFHQTLLSQEDPAVALAYGTEEGKIGIHKVTENFEVSELVQISPGFLPSKAINQVRWRPGLQEQEGHTIHSHLAVASDDCSVRLYTFINIWSTFDHNRCQRV
ncbi:MAG: hypothetical protein Q9157_005943 [Trypethelium eluteriae]